MKFSPIFNTKMSFISLTVRSLSQRVVFISQRALSISLTALSFSLTALSFALVVLPSNALAQDVNNNRIKVGPIDTLEFPKRCTNVVDRKKRIYRIEISNVDAAEKIKFINIGPHGRNVEIPVTELLAGEVKLPSMRITGGNGEIWQKRGLWVEDTSSGKRQQLNYLPGESRCNSKGVIVISYRNLWVTASKTN